jgi:Lysyl oxidase/S-layer homology domain
MGARLVRLTAIAALVVGVAVSAGRGPAQTQAGTEVVPDLAMAPLSGFHIQTVNGRRLLRFTAMMVNIGDGHFELRGRRTSTSQPMVMRQQIFETRSHTSPVARTITTDAVAKYSGDGHNHWHVQEMMRYDLWGARGNLRGAKVGFCFLDSDPFRLSLPGAGGSYYRGSWCSTDPNALSNRMGISIGWGDEYEWYLAWQWVDITGLPSGTYTVRSKVDPYGFFTETREGNQCAYAVVRFRTGSTAVSVVERANQCVNDWSDSRFAADIAWMYDTGITSGCAPDLFCTNNAVRRDQMASFLRRALSLPAASRDFFTDDNTNSHEDSINRLAASGITSGCAPGRYCPLGKVTRAQMATFLSRALSLPATSADYFTDDEGSKHEWAINRLAASGITFGCAPGRFCPDAIVTRGQMAAFLHRALT